MTARSWPHPPGDPSCWRISGGPTDPRWVGPHGARTWDTYQAVEAKENNLQTILQGKGKREPFFTRYAGWILQSAGSTSNLQP